MHSRKPSTAAGDHFEILMYIRRKPGTSREEFYKHWQLKHARLIAPWAEKHGVVSYTQVRPPRTQQQQQLARRTKRENEGKD
jgi:hypothetical protein